MLRTSSCVLGVALALAGFLGFILGRAFPVAAQEKVEPIKNLEAHIQGDEAYQKADLAGRLEMLNELVKQKKIDSTQQKWTQVRELLAAARREGVAASLEPMVKWLAARVDYKHPVGKAARGAVDELIGVYGTERLYRDETFRNGDTIQKLQRVNDLFQAREIGQSLCYELNTLYVYRYLEPAKGNIQKELALLGELNDKRCINWASGGWIEACLTRRALHEDPTLDTLEKKLAYLTSLSSAKKVSWMTTGNILTAYLVDRYENNPEFLEADAAARTEIIRALTKAGTISSAEEKNLIAAYAALP